MEVNIVAIYTLKGHMFVISDCWMLHSLLDRGYLRQCSPCFMAGRKGCAPDIRIIDRQPKVFYIRIYYLCFRSKYSLLHYTFTYVHIQITIGQSMWEVLYSSKRSSGEDIPTGRITRAHSTCLGNCVHYLSVEHRFLTWNTVFVNISCMPNTSNLLYGGPSWLSTRTFELG